MDLRVLQSRRFVAGLLFATIGVFIAIYATRYRMGTATNMGPGYFPEALGIILVLLGSTAMFKAMFIAVEPMGEMDWLPLVFVTSGVVLFAVVLERWGLVPAMFAVIIVSSYDRLRHHLLEVLATFVVVSILTVVLFVYLLQLPLRLF